MGLLVQFYYLYSALLDNNYLIFTCLKGTRTSEANSQRQRWSQQDTAGTLWS